MLDKLKMRNNELEDINLQPLIQSRCDCGELVLDPEALHKEAQDGAVQVLLEGGAAEVVALVRVDLKGAEDSATWPPPPCGPGAR